MSHAFETRPPETPIAGLVNTAFRSQPIRYLVAGLIAAIVDLTVFHLLAVHVMPCVDDNLGESVRSNRFMVDKTIAFLIANVSSYVMNSRWVFTPGRHRKVIEVVLFFGVSMLSYGCGMQFGRSLIEFFSASSHLAAIACIGLATVMNYAIRKTLVFRQR